MNNGVSLTKHQILPSAELKLFDKIKCTCFDLERECWTASGSLRIFDAKTTHSATACLGTVP